MKHDKLEAYYDELDISELCESCIHSTPVYTEGECLCTMRGIVDKGYHCKKFFYDLTKRSPRRMPKVEMPDRNEE